MDLWTMAKWIGEIDRENGTAIRDDDVNKVLRFLSSNHLLDETKLEHFINEWRNTYAKRWTKEELATHYRMANYDRERGIKVYCDDEIMAKFEAEIKDRKMKIIDGLFYADFDGKDYLCEFDYERATDEQIKDEYHKWLGKWRYEMAGEGYCYDAYAEHHSALMLKKVKEEMTRRGIDDTD